MGFRATGPAQDTGYNRTTDWPVSAGAGFRVDGISAGIGARMNLGSSTIGPPRGAGTGNWHPTILWMLGFVLVELFAYSMLSRTLHI